MYTHLHEHVNCSTQCLEHKKCSVKCGSFSSSPAFSCKYFVKHSRGNGEQVEKGAAVKMCEANMVANFQGGPHDFCFSVPTSILNRAEWGHH